MRQQIAQETFPNELEGLVPSPRAAALLACLARQRLALAGGPTLRGEQRSERLGLALARFPPAHPLLSASKGE